MTTYQHDELEIQRARMLDQVDDIVNTASEAQRSLTAEEVAQVNSLNTIIDTFTDQLRARRPAPSGIPGPNQIYGGATAGITRGRTLDEILWATPEVTRAGVISRNGRQFLPNPYGATNEVDAPVIGYDGGAPIHAPRLSEFSPEQVPLIRSFQQLANDMTLFGCLIDHRVAKGSEGFEVARSHPMFRDRWTEMCRALDVDTSGQGGNWVPTGIGATMHEKVRAMGKVAPLFQRIDLPTNPWKWPVEGSDAVAYRVAEPTSDTETKMTASTPGTVAPTFDAEIFGARVLFSRSLDADSAYAILPFTTNKLARAHAIAEERTILDGDTDGTHQDTDVQAIGATDARTAWDGLRKKALAQTAQATTTSTAANLALIRKAMGKWGIDPAELAIIVGVQSYYALMSDTSVLTVDKFGPQATILAGQLASLNGAPIIVSEYVREDLNASGVNDGITTTKTYMMLVNRSEWAMGQRMALEIEVDDSIYRETYQRVAVAFRRQDFQHIGEADTDDNTAIGYNVTAGS